jgi:poly-gamma-glutamate synthesis protein (capsule biosynthesis protein)
VTTTLAVAAAAGLGTVGAGRELVEARRGLVVDVSGTRVGLLAYAEDRLLWRLWLDQVAASGHPGVATFDAESVRRDVARLRRLSDLVVVQLHGGDNYAPPTEGMLRMARQSVAAGADLVVGHHPHVPHPILLVEGKPVLLSLGNLAFGTRGHPSLRIGLAALVFVADKRLTRLELVPVHVQNAHVRYQPRPLEGLEADSALAPLVEASRAEGAPLVLERGRAVLHLGPLPAATTPSTP